MVMQITEWSAVVKLTAELPPSAKIIFPTPNALHNPKSLYWGSQARREEFLESSNTLTYLDTTEPRVLGKILRALHT